MSSDSRCAVNLLLITPFSRFLGRVSLLLESAMDEFGTGLPYFGL